MMCAGSTLRGLFYRGGLLASGQGVGSEFRGYANQEAHYTDLKQIPLRQIHCIEQLRCNVKMQQASTYQRDPTDVVGNPSNQLQTNDVAHGETLLRFTGQENG